MTYERCCLCRYAIHQITKIKKVNMAIVLGQSRLLTQRLEVGVIDYQCASKRNSLRSSRQTKSATAIAIAITIT